MSLEALKVRPGETLCDLQRDGLVILQSEHGFRFGTDSVLLADFCRAKPGERIVDMGTGSGVIPLLLSARAPGAVIDAIELDEATADRAGRSVALNGLADRIRVRCADVRDAMRLLGHESVRLVVSNPPYVQPGAGLTSPNEHRALARGGESACPIEDWVRACGALLQNGGRLCLVFPASGLLRLADAMRACRIEPKRLRFVCAGPDKPASLLLIEGKKQAGPGLCVEPMLVTHEPDGTFTPEMRRIYGERV